MVLTVHLALARRGKAPVAELRMLELNDVNRVNLLASLQADSATHSARGTGPCGDGRPHLLKLVPDTVDVSYRSHGSVELVGCGFADTNTVRVGPASIARVPAIDGGTRLRIAIPLTLHRRDAPTGTQRRRHIQLPSA